MTGDEKAKLTKDFEERYRPAVQKWFGAYEGRVPFRIEDFTLDKFHSRLGNHVYTFMIGETTFSISDSTGQAKVMYLMTREGAQELNTVPKPGTQPNLTVPVNAQELIPMLKADTGVEFKQSEIWIKPTGAACAMMGGAFVEVGKDANNGAYRSFSPSNMSLVFGPDGKLVNYLR